MTRGAGAVHAWLVCGAEWPAVPPVLWEVPVLECSAQASMLSPGAPPVYRITMANII
jgi:hypothetical protein